MQNSMLLLSLIFISYSAIAQESVVKALPKYGPAESPKAERLFVNHKYIQANAAPDFWALMPYYVPQYTPAACSVASSTIVLNAANANVNRASADENYTQEAVIDTIMKNSAWSKAIGKIGTGTSLDQFAKLTEDLFQKSGLKVKVRIVHANDDKDFKNTVLKDLIENEKSDRNFIIANFLQSEFTNDPEGAVGHLSPVGAYDAEAKKVLVLDVDRKWYEPYWVSVDTFISGIKTKDKSANQYRGYIFIQLI
jgi:hypothetical protein